MIEINNVKTNEVKNESQTVNKDETKDTEVQEGAEGGGTRLDQTNLPQPAQIYLPAKPLR